MKNGILKNIFLKYNISKGKIDINPLFDIIIIIK